MIRHVEKNIHERANYHYTMIKIKMKSLFSKYNSSVLHYI